MLLNDIGKSPNTTIRKINQHLETNYGFKIAEDVSDRDLVAIMEQIEGEITELKIKGDDSKGSPEISKRLLVLEGMRTLREFAILQFQSPDLEKVICGMCDFVCDNFRISGMHHGDFDDSVKDAMKQYRSSKYRFPDEMIEQRVRAAAMDKLKGDTYVDSAPGGLAGLDTKSMFEDGKWNHIGKRDTEIAGNVDAADAILNKTNSKLKTTTLVPKDEPNMSSASNSSSAGRNFAKPGPRPVRKESVMKEQANLVKKLRYLLETEVQEAEVMMGAKKFSEELQEMIEKIGRLQNENLPPVVDKMRNTYGNESSSTFQTQIYGAFQGVMDALYTAKGQVDDAVTNLATTGQVSAQTDMDVPVDGMDPGMVDPGMEDPGMEDPNALADPGVAEPPLDLDNIEGGDEFGGAAEEEPLGRAMKEAALQRKVMEMRKLVEKARRLREARV